ncbi:MAG: SMP-30/gluconolactonase/LRE family protein [Candidatus Dormibacteria bacterium]
MAAATQAGSGRYSRGLIVPAFALLLPLATMAGSTRGEAVDYPVTQAPCLGVNAAVTVFHPMGVPGKDWREEIAFDGLGYMWVSGTQDNVLERYDPAGQVTETIALSTPGGLVLGADGLIYANTSGGPAGTGVVRFDPGAAAPNPSVFVTGLPAVNATAFDQAGNLYETTEDQGPSVLRIRPDGTRDTVWENAASFYGANGVAVGGSNLYAAITWDQRSPIELVPLGSPAARSVFTELSAGVLSREPAVYPPDPAAPVLVKGLDDLTIGPDGLIYVVGFASGELLRVDPGSGEACLLASGLVTPTAVQFAQSFGSFDPARDVFVTEATGRILQIHLGA